ncbi:MAG: hypothetical protein EOO74_05995 [Myxococcales bacterium]|nr:MAG: hypothetical protein EOO74_05995 [Myxococcales bacterium]
MPDPDCSAPAGWTCDPTWYNDGACRWACGLHDPDCDLSPDWTCDPNLYGDGKCDQNCGAADPDCLAPAGWICDPYAYNSGPCNKDCGVADPDCAPPKAWTCDPAKYADGNCDQGCGDPDPDCPPPPCTMTFGAPDCNVCLKTNCCKIVSACLSYASCLDLFKCIDTCPTLECDQQCRASHPKDLAAYDEMMVCGVDKCAVDCSLIPKGDVCETNADCVDSFYPTCRKNKRCGLCIGDAGCDARPDTPTCNINPETGSGSCGKCFGAYGCTGRDVPPICNSVTGKCGDCATNADCVNAQNFDQTLGLTCNQVTHKCDPCYSNAECPEDRPSCTSAACQPCKDFYSCVGSPFGSTCNPDNGRCKTCGNNSGCDFHSEGALCLPSGSCGCTTNADCPFPNDKPNCVNSLCVK